MRTDDLDDGGKYNKPGQTLKLLLTYWFCLFIPLGSSAGSVGKLSPPPTAHSRLFIYFSVDCYGGHWCWWCRQKKYKCQVQSSLILHGPPIILSMPKRAQEGILHKQAVLNFNIIMMDKLSSLFSLFGGCTIFRNRIWSDFKPNWNEGWISLWEPCTIQIRPGNS